MTVEDVDWITLVYLDVERQSGTAVARAVGDGQASIDVLARRLLAGLLGTMCDDYFVNGSLLWIDGQWKRRRSLRVQEDRPPTSDIAFGAVGYGSTSSAASLQTAAEASMVSASVLTFAPTSGGQSLHRRVVTRLRSRSIAVLIRLQNIQQMLCDD